MNMGLFQFSINYNILGLPEQSILISMNAAHYNTNLHKKMSKTINNRVVMDI